MKFEALKVGELAKRTGLTVRTLHHYDEIGLLEAVAAHRIRAPALHGPRLARLQQILSLRQLGFSLERDPRLPGPARFLAARGDRHARRTPAGTDRAAADGFVSGSTRSPLIYVRRGRSPPTSSRDDRGDDHDRELLHARTDWTYLKKRKEQVGDDRIQQVQQEWPELIAQVRAEMEKGTDPTAPEVLALARRWMGLVNEFTGGDQGIERSVGRLWNEQGDNLVAQHGTEYDSRDVFEYIGQAMAVLKGSG